MQLLYSARGKNKQVQSQLLEILSTQHSAFKDDTFTHFVYRKTPWHITQLHQNVTRVHLTGYN